MKGKDIFLGTIKKCTDLDGYEKYGEERYMGDFIIGHFEIGTLHRHVDIIDEKAILIKINEEKYIWINLLDKFTDELLVNLGIPINTISTNPISNNSLFVDKETLVPYFKDENNKNFNVKSLKKMNQQLYK